MGAFVKDNTALPVFVNARPPAGKLGELDASHINDLWGAAGDLRTHTAGWVNVKTYGAVGNGTTDDRAAIQAAIDATPAGGTLVLPAGLFLVNAGLPLTITKSITIVGQGGHPSPAQTNSMLMAPTGLSAATDVISVQPAGGAIISVKFVDFGIIPQSGTPGRYGIHLDGASGQINQTYLDHVYVGHFGTAGFRADGSGGGNGTPYDSKITRCYFAGGGLSFANCGDNVKIRDSTIVGSGSIDVTFLPAVSMFELTGNNIESDGGIHIATGATIVQVVGNQIQTQGTFTGSNGAVLDIDGTAGSHAVDTLIAGNSFQVVNGITANGIRLNFSDRAIVAHNRFGRGAGASKDIQVTANATDTYIGPQIWTSGGPYTSMVADAGTTTTVATPYPSSGVFSVPNNKYFGTLDDLGNSRRLIGTDNTGTTNIYGYRGQPMLSGNNGALLLFDSGAGANIGGVIGTATSVLPVAATIASFANLFVNGHVVSGRTVLTYSATITTDASLGNSFSITATNGTAFTISNPTNLTTGQRVLYTIRNTSGGAHGAITWGTGTFKTAAAALTVATGNSKSIEFVYDGTNLIELWRSAADVAN